MLITVLMLMMMTWKFSIKTNFKHTTICYFEHTAILFAQTSGNLSLLSDCISFLVRIDKEQWRLAWELSKLYGPDVTTKFVAYLQALQADLPPFVLFPASLIVSVTYFLLLSL